MVTQQTLQFDDGGSIPTSPHHFKICECTFADISFILRDYHYKGEHIGGGISHILCLRYGTRIIGGIVVGKMRHTEKYSSEGNVVELRRMALIEEAPKNSESYFLAKTIWWLRKHTDVNVVYSFADMSVGHKGTIYKAANFEFIRETEPTTHIYWKGKRYHPRSLSIERPYSHKLRQAVKDGEAEVKKELPKKLFRYIIK